MDEIIPQGDEPIATIDGVFLTPEQSANNAAADMGRLVYPYLMGLSYAHIAELIDVLVKGGMPPETAKVRAAEIATRAMERFKASQQRGIM